MAALTIYLDDSGTSPSNPIAVAAGWVSTVKEWRRFIRDWNEIRGDEQFDCFHMAEFMASNEDSDFANWGDAKKKRVIHKIRKLILRQTIQGFGVAVHKKDYEDLVRGNLRRQCGQSHYTWAIRTVISAMENWRLGRL